VFATFEQADNLQTVGGQPVEDRDGKVINPPPGDPTQPKLIYQDGPPNPTTPITPTPPFVAIEGTSYCSNGPMDRRLFLQETSTYPALPSGGNICINRRYHDIPPVIVAVNKALHAAIDRYNTQNNVTDSPWGYYKLVNVQAYPFDKSQIDPNDPNGNHNPSTFSQSNSVIETDYTLQNFSGRLAPTGPSTDYPKSGTAPDFKNLHLFAGTSSVRVVKPGAYNMGGCQGCHANAQLGGTDFSFLLDQNSFQQSPDTPATGTSLTAVRRNIRRFDYTR
jgi:hypothetical protein